MNACASSPSGNAAASHDAQTTPPAAPEKPTEVLALAARRARRQLRREAGGEQQLEPEGELVGVRRVGRVGVEQRQLVAAAGGRPLGMRLGRRRTAGRPRRRRARRRRASRPCSRSRACGARRVGARSPSAGRAALVQDQVAARKNGSSRPPKRLRGLRTPLAIALDAPAVAACRGAGCGRPRRSASSAARRASVFSGSGHRPVAILCEVMAADHRLHHRSLLVLRARQGAARRARARVRRDQSGKGPGRSRRAGCARTGMMSFPQVLIGGELVGGFQETLAADRAGPAGRAARGRRLTRGRGWQRSQT